MRIGLDPFRVFVVLDEAETELNVVTDFVEVETPWAVTELACPVRAFQVELAVLGDTVVASPPHLIPHVHHVTEASYPVYGLVLRPMPVLLGDGWREPVVMAVRVISVTSVLWYERVHYPFLCKPCCGNALKLLERYAEKVNVAVETTALVRPHERFDGFHDTS